MNRVVQGDDGRQWVVTATLEWRPPATADDFEHDVAGSYAPGIAMAITTLALAAVLLIWLPDNVVIPAWVPLLLVLVILFFPLRWVLRRPWTVVAHTDGDGDRPPERWVGMVRGLFAVRSEVSKVIKTIHAHSLPDFDGPLHPVE